MRDLHLNVPGKKEDRDLKREFRRMCDGLNRWEPPLEGPEPSATIVLTLKNGSPAVEVAIRKMGNSQGVLIPKPILAQVGLEGSADLQVREGVIEIRAIRRNPREGWADDARRLAEQGDEGLVWPQFANEGDDELVW